ncbi:MAG: hypothetical protein U0168_23420 [Nannocystaceae bacterium]|jgi:hypothetical protein
MKITSTLILGVFSMFALSAVPACDDKKDDKKAEDKKDGKAKADDKKAEEKKAEEKKADPAPEEKKEEAKAEGGGGGGGGDKVGVPECDEYIEKYTKCISDKVPEAARGSMKDAMDASAKAWREAASGPGKDGLAAACKAALDAAKQATAAMGCEW